jgi:hypothetical protein
VGISLLISVTAAIVVGVGGFLLGWRWPRSAASRQGDGRKTTLGGLPWSLLAVGLVAVAATNAWVARSVGTDQPVAPITGEEDAAGQDAEQDAAEQAGAQQELPDQGVKTPNASTSEPVAWPPLPDCFVDDYLVHESSTARDPHYVAENKSSVIRHAPLVSMMIVDDDRIIGGLRISFSPAGQGSYAAHDAVDASCGPVEFSEDPGDAPPDPSGTGQLTVALTLEGQPYELEIQRQDIMQASASLRPAG